MKIKRVISTLLLAVLVVSCETAELGQTDIPYDGELIEIPVNLSSAPLVKSAKISNDAAIGSAVIAWYQDGVKKDDKTLSGGSGSIKLAPGTYNFYAVTNGAFTFPQNESDIASTKMSISPSSFSTIPMGEASIIGRSVTSSSSSLSFSVKRLCAKLNFTVEQNYDMGSFTVTSFRIRQAATKALPFGSDYAATSDAVGDLDYASGTDIYTLSQGGSIVLYTPENMMGTCSSVTSSANKEPSYLNDNGQSALASKATYVEVSGKWTAKGVSANVTYRMYLGGNITSDFNIKRNCQYNLTLSFGSSPLDQEGGNVLPVWKIDIQNVYDYRELTWETGEIGLCRGDSDEIGYSVYPSDVDYEVFVYDGDIKLQNGSWVTGNSGMRYKLDTNQHKVYLEYPADANDGIERIDLYIHTLDDYVNETAVLVKIDYANTHSNYWAFADDYETPINDIGIRQWNYDYSDLVLISDDEPSSINVEFQPSHRNGSISTSVPMKYIGYFDNGIKLLCVYQVDLVAMDERVEEGVHYQNHVWLWNFTNDPKNINISEHNPWIPSISVELYPYNGGDLIPIETHGESFRILDSENVFYNVVNHKYYYPIEAGTECFFACELGVSGPLYLNLYQYHSVSPDFSLENITESVGPFRTNLDSDNYFEVWFSSLGKEPWEDFHYLFLEVEGI